MWQITKMDILTTLNNVCSKVEQSSAELTGLEGVSDCIFCVQRACARQLNTIIRETNLAALQHTRFTSTVSLGTVCILRPWLHCYALDCPNPHPNQPVLTRSGPLRPPPPSHRCCTTTRSRRRGWRSAGRPCCAWARSTLPSAPRKRRVGE